MLFSFLKTNTNGRGLPSSPKDQKVREVIDGIKGRDLYPDIRVIQGKSIGEKIKIDGKDELLFCGYDYLGLGSNLEVINAIKDGLDKFGTQSGGTPLVSGTLDIHKEAERSVSGLVGTEAAMLFTSGALANVGVIPALMSLPTYSAEFYVKKFLFMQNEAYIFSDELNHATIVDGCRLAKAKIVVYKHKDMKDLSDKLSQYRGGWRLIVTDGVFSMDGDIAPLPRLKEIAKENNAWLMVDDAHSVGVLGENGEGTAGHFKIQAADITVGALGKAVSILGGFAAVSNSLSDYLRVSARPGIFSGSLPPALAQGLIKSIAIVKDAKSLRKKLHDNSDRLRTGFKEMGLDTLYCESPTPIIPLMIGEDEKSIVVSRELQARGFFAPAIRWPAVPKKASRIRFTVQANNTSEQIDSLLKTIKELDSKYQFAR